MHDGPKIIAGIVIFIGVVTLPIWFTMAAGNPADRAQPELPTSGQCVESAEYMRDAHMDLLNEWRQQVVRKGKRVYVASDGTEYDISLQNTCLDCHSNREAFCDRCHDYAGVQPDCWQCHLDPNER